METTFKRDSKIISFMGGDKFLNKRDEMVSFRGGGDGENFKYPYPNEKPNEILISNETMRWSSSIHIYRGSQNIIYIWSDKHRK